MASSSSSSSSSSSKTRWKYDVFLSFRGEDTRHGFTDHLYKALRRENIHVFRGDEQLQQSVIDFELMKAIEESQYAIIVFSENYADSKWCLDELAEIVQFRKKTGITVLPVFHHLDQSHVRNQTGPFAIAFDKHEKDGKINVEKMQKWKDALREVANLPGWDLNQRPELIVSQNIVGSIHSELYGEFLSGSKDLVGIKSSVEEMMDLLNAGLNDVRFIGIWGNGGVGKTTLAEVIFCKICNQFDAKSFIRIDSVMETGNDYLAPLQKQLLYNIFNERELNIMNISEGKQIIRQRLCRKKVLIVFDNVNAKDQLDAFAGSRDWFGPGSRIIITSRDKQLLTIHEVDDMYEAKRLDNDKALELFSQRAFKQSHPKKDFVNMCNDFVKYAKGLPLALEVFGSFLFHKEIDVWKSFLDQLNKNPNEEIVKRLEISFKRLEHKVKELFLDIAFFFKGMEKNRVVDSLGISSYCVYIQILKDKSLITIFGGKLWMHDLLQEMGREIVHREAPQEPGLRSRLWHHKDIFSVLKTNTVCLQSKVMAAVFVRGAARGAAFGEVFAVLHDTVKNVGSKILMFKSILKSLESNLDLLAPLVEDIRLLNKILDHQEVETKSLIEDMKMAEELLRMCSGVQGWNCLFQAYSARKLTELDEAIVKFCQVHVQAQNRRNILMILELKSSPKEKKWHIKKIRGYLCSVPRAPAYIGLEVPLKVLKTQLLKEKEQHLLLTAPGGCGKTTLVKVLGHDKEFKGKFKDNIFFVPVSKNLNLMVIVQRLFHHLSDQEPEFQSDEDAINQLRELLTQIGPDPILLILDDVWSGSEYHLDKFKFDMPNYNLMVTSRTTFPGFSFTYNLKPLNDEDAMTLFHRSASLQDGSSHIPVEDIKKIVRSCGGFPLALEVIGLSLNGKPVEVWQSRARKWSNGHSILNSSSYLRDCLRRSLEFSDDQVTLKDYFMDLGSFPEDHRIPVPALIDMWAELYGLDEDGIDVIANLRELSTQKLANLVITRKDASEIKRYYNEDFVTQHKLLRELAIYESSQVPVEQRQRMIMEKTGNSPPSTKQKKQLINGCLLSISTNELFSSSWCNIQAPKVKVLVLNFQTKTYSLPEFVEMDELKVLIITNCGFFPAELRNFQQLGSLPNLKRIRLEKVSIPSLCKNPVLLRSLEKISLFMCNIGHTFGNFIQVSDALPNLMEINIDYCNDLVELPAGLCEVILLKTLSITNCHKLSVLPKGIEMLVNLEVLRLRSCTDLSELPDSIRGLHKLRILDISDCLSIRHLPKDIGELCNLEEIHMNGCLRLRNELPQSTTNLEQLKLVICDVERAKLWEPIKEVLTNLEVKVAEKDINLNWLQS